MSLEISIEKFSNKNLEQIFELFSSYFSPGDKLLSAEYCEWLYAGNPFGNAVIVTVCDGQRLVGFMALIPVTLIKVGEYLSTYYVVNVLVHRNFQGKNLFDRMIDEAMTFIKSEGAALMGHPNSMALKAWQRKKMSFQKVLFPYLALWQPWKISYKTRIINSEIEIETARDYLHDFGRKSSTWRIDASPEYLAWRFLKHPTNKYYLQKVECGGELIGIQITKKLNFGVNLLIDQLIPECFVRAATGKLLPFTICFEPYKPNIFSLNARLPIPLKKRIPFFLTAPNQQINSESTAHIGFCPSDF